jgi:hypothetical protein
MTLPNVIGWVVVIKATLVLLAVGVMLFVLIRKKQ